jgi:hypothetical protein
MTPSSSGAMLPDERSGLRLVRYINRGDPKSARRAPMHSDLKVSAAAVDDKSCQDNEKHNGGGARPPVIFAPPWVGPPAVVTGEPLRKFMEAWELKNQYGYLTEACPTMHTI